MTKSKSAFASVYYFDLPFLPNPYSPDPKSKSFSCIGLDFFLFAVWQDSKSRLTTSAEIRHYRSTASNVMSDFILTLDSDEEDYAPGPSSKRKQTKKTNASQKVNGDADATAEEIALDDGFTFDVGGGVTMNGRNLQDGVDFWGAEADEVKGGQGVSTSQLAPRLVLLPTPVFLSATQR